MLPRARGLNRDVVLRHLGLPRFACQVVCLSQFTSEKNPAKYPPTTSGEYILSKLAETHNDVYDNEAEALTAAI